MQHYKVVQQRFSSETMNSDDKMEQKQIEATKGKPNGVALPNGVHTNGHAGSSDEDEELVVRKDKGKGKAVDQ